MAQKVYSIGSNVFRFLRGAPPSSLGETTQVISHLGTNYQAVRLVGQRSERIIRQSVADVVDADAGYALYRAYLAFITAAPQQVTWADMDLDTYNMRAQVLNVRLLSLTENLLICGALTPGNKWDLVCEWELLMLPYSP